MTRKPISERIALPEGVIAEYNNQIIKLSKSGAQVEKKLGYPIKIEDGIIKLEFAKPTKKQKKLIKSTSAHIRNLLSGLNQKYSYKLQVCSVHFPMTVSAKGEDFIVKNFLGEVKERKTKILPGVNVKVEKEFVTVEGHDKEKVGQTAANIENVTRICNRDRRIFQDGIYIIEKQKGAKRI